MSLSKYKEKRDFTITTEPKAVVKKNTPSLSFVVQRHKASHLHYDFRLEMDGVLKSWAVPKGPSMNPADKRLAMMVEDHPYDYKDFKGIIPDGYGAGIVEIWDKGKYSDLEDDADKAIAEKKLKAGLKAGSLKFTLHGRKLKGEFALVKIKSKEDNAWLLIKHNDKYATNKEYDSEKETTKSSPINKWLAENAKPKKKIYPLVPKTGGKLAKYIAPMLAKESDKPFDDRDWIFEIKWDGYRAIAEVNKDKTELYSRNGNSFNHTYPLIFNELKKLNINIVLDGEIVVLNDEGRSDFQKLQHYEDNTNYPLCYYVFDILAINGQTTYDIPLLERKALLKKAVKETATIRYSEHIKTNGKDFFEAAVGKDLEGIMGKKADSLYYPGKRTNEWLKIKQHKTAEVVVVGFTAPSGARQLFGALVLAVKDGNTLKYAGHTGSGFNERDLKDVYTLLKPLITNKSPFSETVKTNAPVTWVTPKLIAEIKFTEWTNDGKMRHPIFQRLRDDKFLNDITMAPAKKTAPKKASAKKEIDKEQTEDVKDVELSFGKIKVKTTNRTKIFFPDEGVTKGMVIDYYQQVAPYILPYLKDRPQSLKRNPNGIKDAGFFHKDAGGDDAPSWVKSKKVHSESTNKDIDYIICNDKQTLAYLNNLGCIELNPWNSTTQQMDKPDYMIIDIDPSSKNTFSQVVQAALVCKDILDKAKADCYCKTSGATGMHIFVPVKKKYTYEQVKDFAHIICTMIAEQLPDFTTLERNLSKRGNKKMYLDYLQNRRGQTVTAAYSLRPHPGATVSTPLEWEEVKEGLSPASFTINNIFERIKKKGDLFKPVLGKGVSIEKCLKNLAG